jgi:hypothetical protein
MEFFHARENAGREAGIVSSQKAGSSAYADFFAPTAFTRALRRLL